MNPQPPRLPFNPQASMNQSLPEYLPPPPPPQNQMYYEGGAQVGYQPQPPPAPMQHPQQNWMNYPQGVQFQGEYVNKPYAPLPPPGQGWNPNYPFIDSLSVGQIISCKSL